MQKSGIAVGKNRGFIVTKPKGNMDHQKANRSHRKGRLHPRVAAVRSVINEICGLSPYERKMLELIRSQDARKEKNAVKIARKRLGGQKRALKKRDQLLAILAAQRKK